MAFPAADAITEDCSVRLLTVWIINALALLLTAYLLRGIHANGFGSMLIAVLVPDLVNTLIHPILMTLILPMTLLTFGLFIFIINILLFLFVGNLLVDSQMAGFGAAPPSSILYNVIS